MLIIVNELFFFFLQKNNSCSVVERPLLVKRHYHLRLLFLVGGNCTNWQCTRPGLAYDSERINQHHLSKAIN